MAKTGLVKGEMVWMRFVKDVFLYCHEPMGCPKLLSAGLMDANCFGCPHASERIESVDRVDGE